MSAFEPVRALMRGLEVLRIVSEKGPITASRIARCAGLPQPTAVRLLETLIRAGYVIRDDAALYSVTARVKSLATGYDARSRLVQIAEPLIEALRGEIGWPSNLAVCEGRSMVIAYTNRSAHGMSIPGRLGAQIPMLATAVGVIYLAAAGDGERQELIEALRRSPDRWDREPKFWAALDGRIAVAREQGYAFADEIYLDEVYQSQIWAVAVPILVTGKPVAAISSLILRTVGDRQAQLARILPALRRTATAIGAALETDTAGSTTPDDPS